MVEKLNSLFVRQDPSSLNFGEFSEFTPVPKNRLNEWRFFLKDEEGEVYHLDLRSVAQVLDAESLMLIAQSNWEEGKKPGDSGSYVHGMFPGLNYPVMVSTEPDGGGTGVVIWSIHPKHGLLIALQKKVRFGRIYHEIVRGFQVRGYTRNENALAELSEEAGMFLGPVPLSEIGVPANFNSARHYMKVDGKQGFVYLEGEVSPYFLEPNPQDESSFVLKPVYFAEAPEKETLLSHGLVFYPVDDMPLYKDNAAEQFTLTGVTFLQHHLRKIGRMQVTYFEYNND